MLAELEEMVTKEAEKMEKEEEEFVELSDLSLGKCRLSLAGRGDVLSGSSRLKIATKYPKSSTKYMNSIGIQAEVIYLNGAQEIAPILGLSDAIIDLVDTGKTLKIVKEIYPKAHFATVYAKPKGKEMVDTYITEVSQDTWIFFPWDMALQYVAPYSGND